MWTRRSLSDENNDDMIDLVHESDGWSMPYER